MDLDSVLKQMRTEYTPNDDDRRRVDTALKATLVAGSVTGAAHLAGSSAGLKGAIAKGSLKLLPVWLKGAIGVSATVATVGGGIYGVSEFRSHQPTTHVVPAVDGLGAQGTTKVPAQAVVPAVVAPAVAEQPTVELSQPAQEAATLSAKNQEPAAPRVALRHAHSATPAGIPLTSLGELQLIGEASRALQDGRSADAQKVLREHERRYANTALAQERNGLALLARCANDDASAKVEAATFLQKTPNSPLASRLKRECLQ